MKKIKLILFFSLAFFLGISSVFAACTAEETNTLNSLAVNVKASYEIVEEELVISSQFNFPDGMTDEELENAVWYTEVIRIYVYNLTEDLYLTVYNDVTKETITYNYSDTDNGTITFDQDYKDQITNYTFTVYSSGNTNCSGTKLFTTYLTTPFYNLYSEYTICEGIEDYYLCQEYLSVPIDVSYSDFFTLTGKYKAAKTSSDSDESEESSVANFVKEYKYVIIIASVVIVAAGVVTTVIIVRRKRRKNENEEKN